MQVTQKTYYLKTLGNKNNHLKDFYVCNINLNLGKVNYAYNIKEHREHSWYTPSKINTRTSIPQQTAHRPLFGYPWSTSTSKPCFDRNRSCPVDTD
jgi:hypothetical protein